MDNSSRFVFEIILIIMSALLSLVIMIFPYSARSVVNVELFIYVAIGILNYYRTRAFNLYQVWLVAFVFIVWSEMCILADSEYPLNGYVVPFVRFIVANSCVLLGYHAASHHQFKESKIRQIASGNNLFPLFVFALGLYFIMTQYSHVVSNISGGRQLGNAVGSGSLSGALTSAIGMILPAIIGYYCKYVKHRSFWYSLLLAFPFFVVALFLSTRFRILFCILPYLIVMDVFNLKTIDRKKNVFLIFCVAALVIGSSFVKTNRNVALKDAEGISLFQGDNERYHSDRTSVKLARQMSPEGVVRMARMADRYFENHPLHYGKESSIILYFWFPRSLWPTKPYQLDYWLIREYESVASAFSSASGFIGELRADFGWGCLLVLFFFGRLLRYADQYCRWVFTKQRESYNMVFASILFPWVFFFVRSPITSSMSLIWEIVIYLVTYHLCTHRVRLKS